VSIKKWSEISGKGTRLEGEQVEFKTLIGKTFIVHQFKFVESDRFENKGFIVLQIELGGKLLTCITGSGILKDQLEKHATELPFEVTLAYVNNRYYSFS
jgi:hypothetical protein